jgi:DNA-binding response OmpR family regulator
MKAKKPQIKKNNTPPETLKSFHKKKRVLFVDDDAAIRDVLTIVFERAGYDFETMASPSEILRNKFTIPDLFLIDKQLSGYSGLDVCRFLKEKDTTLDLPVIMISASPDIATLALQAGADDYVEKPFNIKFLVEMISYYIQRVDDTGKKQTKKFRESVPG